MESCEGEKVVDRAVELIGATWENSK